MSVANALCVNTGEFIPMKSCRILKENTERELFEQFKKCNQVRERREKKREHVM